MIVDKPVSPTFSKQSSPVHIGSPLKPGREPHKHPQPLPPSLDVGILPKLPGGKIEIPSFFNQFDNLIDDALASLSQPNCRCPHSSPEQRAMRSFHNDIKSMSQKDLDGLKDTLVKRMAGRDASQNERELMQKLYEITDAVSEHRDPPHLKDFFDFVTPTPIRIGDILEKEPAIQQIEIKF